MRPIALLAELQVEFIIFNCVQKSSNLCKFTHAQSRNLPLTNRRIEFNGKQLVKFKTLRNNNLELKVTSADKAERCVRVRENEVEEFIRAYVAGGTLKTKMIRTTNANFVIEVNDCFLCSEPLHERFKVFFIPL